MRPRACREGRCTPQSKRERSTRSDGRFVPVEGQPGLLVDPLTGARYRASGNGLLYVGLGSSNGRPVDPKLDAHRHPEGTRCAGCSRPIEEARRCYVHPICYACLPPPDPIPTASWGSTAPRFGCQWVAPWNIDWPLRSWAFSWAPDTESWFVRVLGLELSWRKEP